MNYSQLASKESIDNAVKALKANGIDAQFVETKEEAKLKVLELIPEGSEVMNMTSVTIDEIGLTEIIMESDKYVSVRKKLSSIDKTTGHKQMREIGAAPDFATGSVHAVTEDGKILIASNTGSQLPAFAYSAGKVIWVVGAQKIVKDLEQGFDRINTYVLGLESERARKAYGSDGSNVSKVLIVNKEVHPGRLNMIIVEEKLGF